MCDKMALRFDLRHGQACFLYGSVVLLQLLLLAGYVHSEDFAVYSTALNADNATLQGGHKRCSCNC